MFSCSISNWTLLCRRIHLSWFHCSGSAEVGRGVCSCSSSLPAQRVALHDLAAEVVPHVAEPLCLGDLGIHGEFLEQGAVRDPRCLCPASPRPTTLHPRQRASAQQACTTPHRHRPSPLQFKMWVQRFTYAVHQLKSQNQHYQECPSHLNLFSVHYENVLGYLLCCSEFPPTLWAGKLFTP